MSRTDLDLDLLRRVADALGQADKALRAGIDQYASRTITGSIVAADEQYPWVAGMIRADSTVKPALTDLRALIARLEKPISTGLPSPVYVDDEPQDREAGVTGPLPRPLPMPPYEYQRDEIGGTHGIVATPAPQAVDAETAGLVERLRERTALKYMGDCKCRQCQLVPLEDVRLAYDTIVALSARATAAEAARDEAVRELNETWTDVAGTVWSRPTAWAYAQTCKALHKAKDAIRDRQEAPDAG